MYDLDILRTHREGLGQKLLDLDAAAGERSLNPSEQGKWNRLTHEIGVVDGQIAEAEEDAARAERTAANRAKWGSLQIGGPTASDPWDGSVRSESPDGYRQRAHDVLDRHGDGLSDQGREALAGAVDSRDNGGHAAEFVVARANPHYASAYRKILENPERAFFAMTPAESQAFSAVEQVRAAMGTGTGTAGYLLPLALDPNVAALVNNGAANPVRALATVKQTVSSPHRAVTSTGITAAWTAEGVAFGDNSPTFVAVDIPLHKLAAFMIGTYELIEDSAADLFQVLPQLLADARDRAESDAYVVGSGSGAPKGLVTALSASSSFVTCTTRGSFTSASAVDTIAMLNALPPRARQSGSAVWLGNVTAISTIRQQVVGTAGVSLVSDLADAGIPQLMGLPVYEASAMTSATTSGSHVLVAVDLKAYRIADSVAGPSLEFVPVVYDPATGRPNGTRGWVYHQRTGADLLDGTQGRILKA